MTLTSSENKGKTNGITKYYSHTNILNTNTK
jgi:hypothetical protein